VVNSILCLLNIAENGAWGKIGAVDINTEDERQIDLPALRAAAKQLITESTLLGFQLSASG
jgi:hypothetical protein